MKRTSIVLLIMTLGSFYFCESQNIAKDSTDFGMKVLFQTEQVKILGDTDDWQPELFKGKYFAFKFPSYIKFSDFPATNRIMNKKVKINLSSNTTAKRYRTVLHKTYEKEGINFAGYYCFVFWGCGSPCQQCALIDSRTGKVYDGPSAGLGYEYHKESRMLIVNPPSSTGWYLDLVYGIPELYIWNEQTKSFEKR